MPKIQISEFRGLLPKVDRRNLPAGFAQQANNVRFDAGDLSPIRSAEDYPGLLGSTDTGTIHYHRDDQEQDGTPRLIAFGSNLDVYFARSPIPDDEHSRLYWSVYHATDPANPDNGLRAVANPLSVPDPAGSFGSGADYREYGGYRVGVPAPTTAPLVEDSTVLAEVNGVNSLSATQHMTVGLVDTVPFVAGAQVRIVIDESLPRPEDPPEDGTVPGDGESYDPIVGRLWALNGQIGRVANVGASGGDTFDIIGVNGSSLGDLTTDPLTDTEKAAVKIERVLTDQDMESRSYVFTYVTRFGEEGPPSPASDIIDVPMADGVITLSLGDEAHDYTRDGGSRENVDRIRIYRTVVQSNGATQLRFVDEVMLPPGNYESGWSGIDVVDNNPPEKLGDQIESEKWYPPPVGLQGIHLMPNGFLSGWKGNALYFSEPNRPHAWNPDYRRTTDHDILGVQSFGNTLVIGTRGRPYLATGTDPAAIRLRKLDEFAPLEKPKAMVDAGAGVLYPSTTGLYLVNQSGATNITENHFDKRTWESSLRTMDYGIYHDNRVIFFGRGQDPFVIDMNGKRVDLSRLTGYDIAAACILESDLALVVKDDLDYNKVVLFKSDGENNNSLLWKSGLLTMPKAVNMAVCQVFADDYPLIVGLCHADLQEDGQPDLDAMVCRSWQVYGPEPFRLPADYLSREFAIEVFSSHRVQSVTFATSMADLRT